MTILSKTSQKPLDVITLKDLLVHCVIGVNPEEKVRTQALRLDIKLYLDVSAAAVSGILAKTIDYSLVAKELSFILKASRFRLLESAAEALAIFLLSPVQGSPEIQAVDIEIHKPEALGGQAIPSVRIFRDQDSRAGWLKASDSSILFQVPEAVLERKTLVSKGDLILEEGEDLTVMTEGSGLLFNDKPLPSATVLSSATRVVLHNPTSSPLTVLSVTFRGRERFQLQQNRLH